MIIFELRGLFHIMDHEVIPCSSKICDGLLNSSRDHFGLHQEGEEKKCWSDHGTWGPQKAYFWGLQYPLSWSKGFCNGTCKRGSLPTNVKGPWHKIVVFVDFNGLKSTKCLTKHFHGFEERRKEEEEKVKHDENFQNCPFWHISKENPSTSDFLVHGHFSWSTSDLHTSQGPKNFLNALF